MDQTVVDKMTKIHYLLEGRPLEGGRVACIQHNDSDNTSKEIFTEFNITSSVHEYGGGALAVHGGLAIFFDKFTGNVFSKTLETSTAPSILYDSSASTKKNNFADFCIHPSLKIAVCIREVHYGDNAAQVVNSVALFVCETGEIIDLVKGDDFYSTPRFSPCGNRLSWISWNHPSMQWRDSSLFAAAFQNNCISSKIKVNNRSKESISRTVWGIDTIYYATDATGFYNISSYSFKTNQVEAVTSLEADFSSPDWLFGWSTFDLLDDGRLVASYSLKGQAVLAIVDPVLKKIDPISQGVYTTVDCVRTLGNGVYFVAKSATSPLALYKMDIATKQVITLLKSAKVAIDPAFISVHQHLEYPCKDGSTGHMIYYPPLNPNYTLSSPPPLLVHLHGGPTAHAKAGLSLGIQYWTSRGFAYADVNYGGSSGYGREHLERLDSKWGIVDVDGKVEFFYKWVFN
jgi:dipeptidyl aminopeptidase/acylaminoacyl peptidase